MGPVCGVKAMERELAETLAIGATVVFTHCQSYGKHAS